MNQENLIKWEMMPYHRRKPNLNIPDFCLDIGGKSIPANLKIRQLGIDHFLTHDIITNRINADFIAQIIKL